MSTARLPCASTVPSARRARPGLAALAEIAAIAATTALAAPIVFVVPLGAATIVVDRFDDPTPIPSGCSAAAGDCSLRGAILRANDSPSEDLVRLPAGIYVLAITGSAENLGATGDLDLTAPLRIVGDGPQATQITGQLLGDRILDLQASASTSTLEGLTLYNATATTGAGLRCRGGFLTLRGVRILQNQATDRGGGLEISPGCDVGATGLDLAANIAALEGGGAYVEGVLQLVRSRIRFNDGGSLGGGVSSRGGFVFFHGSQLSHNEAASGGGVFAARSAASDGSLLIEDSTVTGNAATSGGGLRLSQVGAQLRHVTFADQAGGAPISVHASGTVANPSTLFVWNSIFADPCLIGAVAAGISSQGGNLEVNGATCELDHASDQPGVTAAEINLLPLADYGGDTVTLALGPASVARGAAPGSCTERDQRWAPREAAPCDSGAFEDRPGFLFADDFESDGLWFWSGFVD
jgi:hypothetical protein